MENNGLLRHGAQGHVARMGGRKSAALISEERLPDLREIGPDLRVCLLVDELGKRQEGSDGMRPGVSLGIDFETPNEEAEVVAREAEGVGDRSGA